MNHPAGAVPHPDEDEHKDAVEDDSPHISGEHAESHGSLSGQLGHRGPEGMTDGSDSDYPEPGSNPEHTGQHF